MIQYRHKHTNAGLKALSVNGRCPGIQVCYRPVQFVSALRMRLDPLGNPDLLRQNEKRITGQSLALCKRRDRGGLFL